MTTPSTSPSGRRPSRLRRLLFIFGGLLLRLVAVSMVVISASVKP